ncbi:PAS domain S-box protein [Thermodesulfobacteriota bacterium]
MADKPTYEELEQQIKELYDKLSVQVQNENLLNIQRDLSVELSALNNLDEGLKLCLDSAIKAAEMDSGGIYLRNKFSGAFELIHHKGLSVDFVKAVSYFASDSSQAKLVMQGRPVYTQHQKTGTSVSKTKNLDNLYAFAVLPLRHTDQVIGCMNVASHSYDKVPFSSRNSLEVIAAQIGSSIVRLQAEEALRESEEKYKELYNEAPVGYMEYDREGNITRVNQRELEMLGYTAKEMLGQPVWNFVIEKEESREIIKAKFSGDKPPSKNLVRTYIRKDGATFAGLIDDIVLKDKTGRIIGIRAALQDITDRKRTEEELRESENFNVSLLDNSPTSILVVNPDTSIKYINPMLEKLTGYSSEELIGQRVPYPWWIEDDPRSGYSAEKKEMMFKANRQFQKIFRKRNGEEFWVEINTVAIMKNEELKYAMSIWIDITERKHSEEELKKNQMFLNTIVDNIPDMIFVKDAEGLRFVRFNKAGEDLLGYNREELIGKNDYDFFPKEEADFFTEKDREVLDSRTLLDITEESIQTLYKGERILHTKKIPLLDEKGQPEYLLGISEDITEGKKSEKEKETLVSQLQQAQKMESIGTLAGGIAHDFNNILSPIMMHSEMAMMDLPVNNPMQYHLKGIYKAGERASDLVKQILTFSRKSEEKRIAIKITPILKGVLKMLRSSIPTTIDIQQNLEATSDTVFADPTQIHQVLLNLGTNAAHAMREKGGILEVSLVQEDLDSVAAAQHSDLTPGSYVKLTVRDTGTGIDGETMQKIFEPYFTTKSIGDGTGMGLSIVHGIVKSYGGDITVESELGKGATFNVYLPRIEEEVASTEEPLVQLPKGSERVLFVDDENVSADVMQLMLENLGYKVTARTSSIEALEAFKNDPNGFDLVITDMTMPNMTGKDLAKEIMSIRSGMPIILCTGFSEQIDESRAKEMGISAYLMKPIVMRDMANTIREVLDKR